MASFQEDTEDDNFHDCVEPPVVDQSTTAINNAQTNNAIVETNDDDVEEIPRIDKTQKNIGKALEAKEKGNDAFKLRDFDLAIQYYSLALSLCPEEETEHMATFYGNRSASYFAEEEFELVVADCTSALELKKDYLKVLARRMQAQEKLEKYDEALADAKRVQEMDPTFLKIKPTIARLEKLNEEKMQKMKDEALGKLKELGNSILGNFGMSLDNFKMEQDPATGSWSVNMKR